MSRDLRRYARQTHLRSLIGFVLLLLLVGDGLIYLFYGRGAAVMGLLCLGAGLAPLVLIAVLLWGMDWFVRRARQE